jgi:POT family proton-dependent oligopeptide transporter
MKLDGLPNDLINNFNSISIIVFSPIVTYLVYPFFERIGYPL